MMEFISIPLVFGIGSYAFYKLVELYVRKKERLLIIEKLSQLEKTNVDNLNFSDFFNTKGMPWGQFFSLRVGSLLLGLGLGLLVGYIIVYTTIGLSYNQETAWHAREMMSIVYGSSTLLFGGAGMIAGFIIERKLVNNK